MTLRQITNTVLAALAAAIAPSALVAALSGSLQILPFVFFVALAHALVLGVPLFLLLRRKAWANGFSATAAGFGIGCLPVGVLTWPLRLAGSGSNSWIGPERIPTVVDGVPTSAGWLAYGELVVQFGGYGALAGLAFWLAIRALARASLGGSGEKTTPTMIRGQRKAAPFARQLLVAGIAAVSIGIIMIPTITKDRSCHNVLRDGRSHIGSQLNIDLQVTDEDWSALTQSLQGFAADHGLAFRNDSEVRPGVVRTLYLSLCNSGVTVATAEQRWAANGYKNLAKGRGVGIAFYQVQENADWQSLARGIVAVLNQQWPGQVQFRGKRGQVVPMPDEIALD